ncbi:hypothetical protein DL96DRAFT_1625887 [Flagelloscypha sp. PMI_526]|nr:hypothetical protein DL96DRAFT_1625887 [Flagelloscypha sp. PMI_526]
MDSPTAPNEDEQMRESLERLELMKKCGRFRVLVVGRANAGKTTICQRMCRTTEPPTIRNVQGNVIDVSPTAGRGEHNIEDEITYEKNSGYVFHDSRGLEAGSSAEKQTLLEFIASRAEKGNLRDQLHAIWFCVPVDDDRPLIEAEQEFFTKERSLVPVILVFTKCEAQQSRHYKGSGDASAEQEKQLLQEALNNANMYLDELASRVRNSPHPPDAIVNIREMHKAKKSPRHCDALLESTGKCLQNDVLKNLLSCVQKNNLNLCIKWAIDDYGLRNLFDTQEKWLDKSFDQNNIYRFLLWFPFHELVSYFCISSLTENRSILSPQEDVSIFLPRAANL